MIRATLFTLTFLFVGSAAAQNFSPEQLEKWRKRFPESDANKDGTLTVEEGLAYLQKMRKSMGGSGKGRRAASKLPPLGRLQISPNTPSPKNLQTRSGLSIRE